jgi:peroxiredoxin Q/BCP
MDDVDTQARFAGQHGFDHPLLSDASGEVATAYGVRRRLLTPVKRATFVIGTDRVIREVITSGTQMAVHADRALAALSAG